MKTLRDKLKVLRERENLSQKGLADLTGISQGAIGDVESGRKQNLSGDSLRKLCNHERFRKYTLWLIHEPSSQAVAEPAAAYHANDYQRVFDQLTPEQQRQAVEFMQLLIEQTGD